MKRLYVTRGMPTTEAGILTVGLGQVYAASARCSRDGAVGVRLYYKPLVLLIWLGSVVMASAARSRSPTGACARRSRAGEGGAAAAVPAE